MIDVAEAKRILLAESAVLDAVEVPLQEVLGRVLAEPVLADRDLPAADVSTMDGFALRSEDAQESGAVLRVVGEVRAGQAPPASPLFSGEARRIFTGALVPPGADTVVMVERTRQAGAPGTVELLDPAVRGENIRRRGEDVARGVEVVAAHARIRAPEAAVLAGVGRERVRVFRRPKVSIVSTGDEVVEARAVPLPHQVRNSNAHGLAAQLTELGLSGVDLGIAPDDPAGLCATLQAGLEGDLLLVTGGVSAGGYDFVRNALVSLGVRILFHGVAVRPGKPILAGKRRDCLVVGLPGNPVSAFTGFTVFVAPALRKMEGVRRPAAPELRAVLAEPLRRRPGRITYHLARVSAPDGRLTVRPVRSQGSGDFASLARANAFAVTSEGTEPLAAGGEVPVVLFAPLDLATDE